MILVTRICSMHLLIMLVRDIGLKLQGLCLSPFLKIGATFASFQSFGTWPVCSETTLAISPSCSVGSWGLEALGPATFWSPLSYVSTVNSTAFGREISLYV